MVTDKCNSPNTRCGLTWKKKKNKTVAASMIWSFQFQSTCWCARLYDQSIPYVIKRVLLSKRWLNWTERVHGKDEIGSSNFESLDSFYKDAKNLSYKIFTYICVYVCVCVCVRAHACMRVRMRVRVYVYVKMFSNPDNKFIRSKLSRRFS